MNAGLHGSRDLLPAIDSARSERCSAGVGECCAPPLYRQRRRNTGKSMPTSSPRLRLLISLLVCLFMRLSMCLVICHSASVALSSNADLSCLAFLRHYSPSKLLFTARLQKNCDAQLAVS